ncbi:MAG TPA: 23S ribosomal RNA methyltransferase Erm, partial [Amycolatopsis sp.]|nr:23S ribosomal RNA methyltransferase Erm [Amycolatopsis sp.]
LTIVRRREPLVAPAERAGYEQFVRKVFTGRGRGIEQILPKSRRRALEAAGIPPSALPRDLTPRQWAALWNG